MNQECNGDFQFKKIPPAYRGDTHSEYQVIYKGHHAGTILKEEAYRRYPWIVESINGSRYVTKSGHDCFATLNLAKQFAKEMILNRKRGFRDIHDMAAKLRSELERTWQDYCANPDPYFLYYKKTRAADELGDLVLSRDFPAGLEWELAWPEKIPRNATIDQIVNFYLDKVLPSLPVLDIYNYAPSEIRDARFGWRAI